MSASAGAQPPVVDGPVARRGSVLALDIGGTKLAAGVIDETGRVPSFAVEPSLAEQGPEPTLERLFALGRRAVEEAEVDWDDVVRSGSAAAARSTQSGAC